MIDDDFDDERPTPPERPALRFTDSERDVMRDRLAVVSSEYEEREITAPVDLFERPVRPTENELVRMLRRNPGQLAEFVAKVAARIHERERSDSDANRKALAEVRELLDRPPDGRVKELMVRVDALAGRVAGLEQGLIAARSGDQLQDVKDDHRFKALEGDARFARRSAQAVLVFLILSIGGAGIWLGIREQKLENVIDDVRELKQKGKP